MKYCFRCMIRFLLLLAVAAWATPASSQDDAAELVERLEEHYDGIDALTVSFRQKTVFAVTRAEQTSDGNLAIRKEDRYRITFDDRVIACDGHTVWSWSRANNQVIVDRYRDDPNSLSPERVLLDIPRDYSAALLGRERLGKEEMTVLKMIPNAKKAPVRWFKLWVDEDDLVVHRVQMLDLSENEITYDLTDIRLNPGLPDSTFRLEVPAGVEILDLR